jgi:anti-sigma factor RsiW
VSHLGDRLSALIDGELDHETRDRALAHVAYCADCRAELDAHRQVKHALAGAPAPAPSPDTVAALLALAEPGGPLPPRARRMPLGPVVPDLPPPGRRPGTRSRRGATGSPGRRDGRRPGGRVLHRSRVVTAGALTCAGLVLGTAFAIGGSSSPGGGPLVPPVAELSVEHGRTSTAVTVGDPGLGLMTGISDPVRTTTSVER